MPIQVPEAATGRTPYGGTGADVITTLDADGDLVPYRTAMSAWDSPTGGTQLTDLQDVSGAPVTNVTQPDTLDPIRFFGPPNYTAPIWVETTAVVNGTPRTTRWQINPADLATRGGGGVTWGSIPGQPPVIAGGSTAADARDVIGAQSVTWVPSKNDLGLGNVANTRDEDKPVSGPQQAAIAAARQATEQAALNRTNHFGKQPVSSIDGLEAEIRRIVAAIGGGTPTTPTNPEQPAPTTSELPQNVQGTGTASAPYTITVTWAPPTDTLKTVAGYQVYRSDPDWTSATLGAGERSFTLTNFTTGIPYRVGVTAVFTDGTRSAMAAAPDRVTFAADSTPTVPTTPTDPGTGGGTTSSAPMAYPRHAVASYHMMWTNSGSPKLAVTPANVNVIRLSFMQGDPPSITGPASEGSIANLGAELKKLRARGVRILASVGGAGGHVNVANRAGFVNGIMNFSNSVCPLDGLDWDLEGPAMGAADVRAICVSLKQQRGTNFAITMAPNGSNIGTYLTIAQGLQADGNLTAFGQQFYDTIVSEGAMMGRLDEYVGRGLPISKYEIGMMTPPGGLGAANYWDVNTCVSRLNAAKAKYPTLGGAYHWQAGQPSAVQWATSIGNIIKTWA